MSEKEYQNATTDDVLKDHYKTCACCGKTFYIPIYTSKAQWKYRLTSSASGGAKQKTLWCCSWNCFSKLKYPK